MRINADGGCAVLGEKDIGGLAPHAGEEHQLREIVRRRAREFLDEHLRTANYIFCLVLKKIDGANYLRNLRRALLRERGYRLVSFKQSLRHFHRRLVARPRRHQYRNERHPLAPPPLGSEPHLPHPASHCPELSDCDLLVHKTLDKRNLFASILIHSGFGLRETPPNFFFIGKNSPCSIEPILRSNRLESRTRT